jgi:RHS repeat-associated protein
MCHIECISPDHNSVAQRSMEKRMKYSRLIAFCLSLSVSVPGSLFASSTVTGNQKEGQGYHEGTTPTDKDPVSMGELELIQNMPLLDLGGPMGLDFAADYNSERGTLQGYWGFKSPFQANSNRWSHNRIQRLTLFEIRNDPQLDKYINIFLGNKTLVFKADVNDQYQNVGPGAYQLHIDNDLLWLADPDAERVYLFHNRFFEDNIPSVPSEWFTGSGDLVYVFDRNGNRLKYTYDGGDNNDHGRLISIEDGLGRSLGFTFADQDWSSKLLSEVTDAQGRKVTLGYSLLPAAECGDSARSYLTSITDPAGNTTQIAYYSSPSEYDCSRIAAITRPLGNTPASQTWIGDKVGSQTDALGNTTLFEYSYARQRATITDPDGTQRAWDNVNHRYPTAMTDGGGKTADIAYDANNRMTGITDRMGDGTALEWDSASGKLTRLQNAVGHAVSYGYTARQQTFTHPDRAGATATFTFHDRTRIDYPDGTFETFVYDAKGNPTTHTDQRGKTWTTTYNDRGQPLTVTNPEGGVITYTYNADATLASRTDSDTGTTTYGYDAYKRLNRITRPDATTAAIAYDLNDRITSVTDENGHSVQYAYDANGNRTRTTDAAGHSVAYDYDAMDRVATIVNRLGKQTSRTYDTLGRLASTTDANGLTRGYAYNSQGWLSAATLGGKTWQTDYDDEGIVIREAAPSGRNVQTQSNKLGITTGITDGLGHATTFTRDSLNRVTAATDPLNRVTRYSYDAAGALAGVTLPGGQAANYSRNGLGLLSRIEDLGGHPWNFAYTPMGRLASLTDPLNRQQSHTYNERGQRASATLADGSSVTYSYDAAGNLMREQHSDGPDLNFTYDALNRLTATNGLTRAYDAEGRIIDTQSGGVSFSASYDDGGRLTTVGYNNEAFAVTYRYDATTGLLSGVSDSLSNTQYVFTYDQDRRLTGITRPNGVNTQYTLDAAGRVTRIQDGTIIDLQFTRDAAGQITATDVQQPLMPGDLLTAGADSFAFDAASQIDGGGYAYDPRGRLTASPNSTFTWDGASRLTGIADVSLTYDGLGGLLTRTEGETSIRYHANHAIGMAPIVAEYEQTGGAWKRFYVWTPDGALLYAINADDNTVNHYHFDQVGTTLALTDANGNVTDRYAYTPYGAMLSHQGSSNQPFNFVGRYGIRAERNALYHMRARYYDTTAARFLTTEPLWPDTESPKALNLYQYAVNDPIVNIDPSGLFLDALGFDIIRILNPDITLEDMQAVGIGMAKGHLLLEACARAGINCDDLDSQQYLAIEVFFARHEAMPAEEQMAGLVELLPDLAEFHEEARESVVGANDDRKKIAGEREFGNQYYVNNRGYLTRRCSNSARDETEPQTWPVGWGELVNPNH